MTMRDAVQIAGVLDLVEAEMLVDAGVGFIGIPLRLLDGREDLRETDARTIVETIGDRAHVVASTYRSTADEIMDLCNVVGTPWVQLHGSIKPSEVEKLRNRRPDISIIKSLVVRPDNEAALAADLGDFGHLVDAFITDTYDPATGRIGATGKTHDWAVSSRLVMASPRPIILAGGLTEKNVGNAVAQVRPAGVDAHTGVETVNGRKDPERVRRFVREAQEAFRRIRQD